MRISWCKRTLAIGVTLGVAVFAAPAAAVAPIGPVPTPDGTVTLSASPVTGLATGQAITFTVNTSGGTTLVGTITAHLCQHGFSTYGTTNFGYSDGNGSRCVYENDITAGGLTGADYEVSYPPYAGNETTSGPLTFHAGTGTVTWGNAGGFGPFTVQADPTHQVDLVIQVNLAGDSVATTYFIQPLTFGNPPGAPTTVKAVTGNASASVSWHAPATNGGSPINGYVVTPFIGATAQAPQTFVGTAVTRTVTGLANGTAYTFKVAAKNAVGTGNQSAASSAIRVGIPKPPTTVLVAPRSTTSKTLGPIQVSYTAGANDGAAISKFTATCRSSNGGVTRTGVHTGASASPIIVTRASLAKTYTCTVTATNARGTSGAAVVSAAMIVGAPAKVAKPTISQTAPRKLKVTFTRLTGSQTNGNFLTTPKYTAGCKSSNGGAAKSATGSVSPITVASLTAGKTYTCIVKAHNARGYGAPSAASAAHKL